jgi:hypothetical protein
MSTTSPKAPIAFNTPPEAPITFESPPIDSDLIDTDLELLIKLDALQVSRSYLRYINELVRYRDPSDPDIQSLLFYYKELLREELNYIYLGIVCITVLTPPSHLSPTWPHDPLPPPLPPATQLQEYKSPFQVDEDNETPVWVSQVVAYMVRKARAI